MAQQSIKRQNILKIALSSFCVAIYCWEWGIRFKNGSRIFFVLLFFVVVDE